VSEDIDLGRGTTDAIQWDTVPVTSTLTDRTGSWYQDSGYGLDVSGALTDINLGGGWLINSAGGATESRTAEVYADIDCRARPDYDAEVRDAAGVDQSGGTVTDTNQPTLFFGAIGYDGLPELNWSVSIGALFSTSGAGAPPTSVPVVTGLPNGAYTATFTVRSTIRGSDPFEHVQTIDFTIDNVVPSPSPPIMTVTPGGQTWDDGYVVAEVWRDDCHGSQRIATVPDGINGSYLDLAIPQPVLVGSVCETHAGECAITYRVRYWGYVSTYVELPDTIPADLILAWPSTAGTIPSGWTRVTALDGRHPRGASGTGVPSGTGGNATHTHTTPGHTHAVAAHTHTLGGNTGGSSTSTTSARYSGASQPQANQPHTHPRAVSTNFGGGANSGSTSPGTDAVDNDPGSRTVIWIESNGSQAAYPVGVLGWATEAVSGWENDASSTGRFLRGAAAAGDGGANSGSLTHTHTVASHTHTGVDHTHAINSTGLSNPVGVGAGTGSSTPRWLPRHTHPMSAGGNVTGDLVSASGGVTSDSTREPVNRRLWVLRNTGGGTQTRIIGLYLGDVASLDPLLTLCDGSNGTPDMRGWFARDAGSDSVNSTGGAATHSHTTPSHTHTIGAHAHITDVLPSLTGSFEAPTFGDLGDSPTTGHDHTSGNTGTTAPGVTATGSGAASTVDHTPLYRDAHFVRLDGTISGGPLPVPELKVSDFASSTVSAFTYGDGMDRLATLDDQMVVVTDRSHAFPRLVIDSIPLDGGLHSVATTLAGEDMTLVIGVEGIEAINELETMLRADRIYYSPVGGTAGWYAPAGWQVRAPAPDVKVLQVTMVAQPWPSTAEPSEYL
jgi:hypothetical protein